MELAFINWCDSKWSFLNYFLVTRNLFNQASRAPLHKAAISGQYEMVKMLLESGEDVDQRDQVLVFPSLYKSNAYGFLDSFLALEDYEQEPCVHEPTHHSNWLVVTSVIDRRQIVFAENIHCISRNCSSVECLSYMYVHTMYVYTVHTVAPRKAIRYSINNNGPGRHKSFTDIEHRACVVGRDSVVH